MAIETPPIFQPIPLDTREAKRGPGRILSQSPAAVKARAYRAGRKGDAKPRRKPTTRRTTKSLKPEIAAFLSLVNGAVIASPLGTRPVEAIMDATIAPTRVGDELDAAEINALAASIDMQCKRSPRFRRYVESVLGAGSGGTLLTVVGIIAARRAARHGVIPAHIDAMGGIILAADMDAIANMSPLAKPEPDPVTGEMAPDRDAPDGDDGDD